MFRVKLQVPKELAGTYLDRIKTGVRGVGYVKLNPDAAWPPRLQNVVGQSQPVACNCE
jgi:HlyD family secretion protein